MLVVVFLLRVGLLTNFRPVICLTYLHVVCGRCCGCGGCRGYKVLPLLLLCILAIDAAWMFSNQFFGQKYASKISRFQYICCTTSCTCLTVNACWVGHVCCGCCMYVRMCGRTTMRYHDPGTSACVRSMMASDAVVSKQPQQTHAYVRTYARTGTPCTRNIRITSSICS